MAFASYPRPQGLKIARTGSGFETPIDLHGLKEELLQIRAQAVTLDQASARLSGEDREIVHLGMAKIVRLSDKWLGKWSELSDSQSLREALSQDLEDWAGYIAEAQALVDKIKASE